MKRYRRLAYAGVERLAEYGHVVDPAEKMIEAAEYREKKAVSAAGLRLKDGS